MEVNLVLNYGRVSSVGIVEALSQAGCAPVLHIHKANLREIGSELVRHFRSGTPVPHDLLWSAAASCIPDSDTLVNVICPIREPLSRDISAITYRRDDLAGYVTSLEFIDDFLGRTISFATDWLLSHLIPFTGIDIFSQEFDPELGYQIYHKKNVRLLMLQAELSHEQKALALQDLLGLFDTPIIQGKVNSSGYSETLLMSLGRRLLDSHPSRIKTDRILTTHFYAEKQVKLALNRLGIPLARVALPDPFRPGRDRRALVS